MGKKKPRPKPAPRAKVQTKKATRTSARNNPAAALVLLALGSTPAPPTPAINAESTPDAGADGGAAPSGSGSAKTDWAGNDHANDIRLLQAVKKFGLYGVKSNCKRSTHNKIKAFEEETEFTWAVAGRRHQELMRAVKKFNARLTASGSAAVDLTDFEACVERTGALPAPVCYVLAMNLFGDLLVQGGKGSGAGAASGKKFAFVEAAGDGDSDGEDENGLRHYASLTKEELRAYDVQRAKVLLDSDLWNAEMLATCGTALSLPMVRAKLRSLGLAKAEKKIKGAGAKLQCLALLTKVMANSEKKKKKKEKKAAAAASAAASAADDDEEEKAEVGVSEEDGAGEEDEEDEAPAPAPGKTEKRGKKRTAVHYLESSDLESSGDDDDDYDDKLVASQL